ncbi:MAG: synthetase, synthase [Candidatus Parcubacteria bacterium]
MSGVGKGIATASIGKILAARGLTVTCVKIDPYINVDAGTMNPTEHGEVFVLDDGDETDQDMGNYERFLNTDLTRTNYMTTGRVYKTVIEKERNLEYGGKCVEVVPHIPLEVIRRIEESARASDAEITIVEVGGTVGEYQNILFLEAARMLKLKRPKDVAFVMVSYLPVPSKIGEMKTKPTQYAVRTLNGAGIHPDFIIARADRPLDQKRKEKLGLFCNVLEEHVISAPDVDSIYDVPINFERDNLSNLLLKVLGVRAAKPSDMKEWKEFAAHAHNGKKQVKIGIVGKYFDTGDYVLSDAYLSVIEAIKFSSYNLEVRPEIAWINAKDIQTGKLPVESLREYDGIIVPGGFGETGIEGKIMAAKFARENKIPYFGLCYGLHMMVIEYARHMAGMENANTTEINPKTPYPVIDILPEQKEKLAKKEYGGTMRLGGYPTVLKEGSVVREAYGKARVDGERHRHRYEINPEYVEKLEKAGLVFSGVSPDRSYLMEIAELPKTIHPFYVGTQFHPELRARPLSPHPLFSAFIKAATQKNA